MPVLNFKGKSSVYSHHLGVPFRSLKVDEKKSLSSPSSLVSNKKAIPPSLDDNLIIQGDNLHALKSLLPRYAGKVKCIYIDPPYNTGKETWVFNDNVNSPLMKEWIGSVVDSDDLERHDKWLCMMWPRLLLLKELLSENGVLICAIDHNEQKHLGLILKEIFPTRELVLVTVVHNPRGIQGANFSYTHEYVYFVLPDKKAVIGKNNISSNAIHWRNLRNDGGESLRSDAKNCFYPIIVKNNKIVGFGDVLEQNKHPKKQIVKKSDGSFEIWPIDKHGVERKWRYARQTVESIKHLLRSKQKPGKNEFEIDIQKTKNEHLSNFRNWGGESLRSDAKNCFYPIIVKNNKIVGFGDVLEQNKHPKKQIVKKSDGSFEIWPIDKHGVERKWRYARQSVESIKTLLQVKQKEGESQHFEVEIGKDFQSYRTVWTGSKYDANEYGTKLLKTIIPNCPFNFPKSFFTVRECLQAVCANDKNAIILDSFAGSGTTAHAVLDMNKADGGKRKFILVECENYADKITAERVRRVIKGVPQAKDEKLKTGLGGSFTYLKLGEEINEENLIKGKSLPSYKVLSSYVYYTATGQTLGSFKENPDFYIGKSKNKAYFLIYKPSIKFLRSKESALNFERKEKVLKIMKSKKCEKAVVFAPVYYFNSASDLAKEGITFCQLPFAIYKSAGA